MSAPRWTTAFLRRLAKPDEAEILVGDLEEAHRGRVEKRGARTATLLTSLETVDIALMLVRRRVRLPRPRMMMSWLDLTLGARMLVRYPVLTIVGGLGLAVSIALGAAAFAFISLFLWPRLPLPDGDRIVAVAQQDDTSSQSEPRVTADYLRWRDGTSTLMDFAAGRGMARNLTMGDGLVEPVSIAEVTASTFAMTRVAPIRGRVLNDDDARATTTPVMVLGERLWRERFAADPDIVGKTLMVSEVPTTVVGVMPAAYRFPSIYEVWQPLKIDEAAAPRTGIGLRIWARLKPGATSEQANLELAGLSAQAAKDWPATHTHLKAAVSPPAVSQVKDPEERTMIASLNLGVVLIVLLVSGNVALLMFARAATRESEIVVRAALGASRGRIVAQFVAEALVLSMVALAAGLWVAQRVMTWGVTSFGVIANDGDQLPFWITASLPPLSIAYGIGLALLATAVTGILPALKMTRGISSRLREASAGGGGLKFGGIWTVLIVSQIAVTVAVPAVVFGFMQDSRVMEAEQIGVPSDRYLSARLGYGSGMTQAQFETAVRRVRDDVAAAPEVARVTFAESLPLMWNTRYAIEVDDGGAAPTHPDLGFGYWISATGVEQDFFQTFEAPPLAGRLMVASDYAAGAPHVVVVNQSFVDRVLGGRNAVGRRVRFAPAGPNGRDAANAKTQPWIEIVGVVRDLAMVKPGGLSPAGLYMPIDLRQVGSVMIAARVSGDMTAATNALRSIVGKADRLLRISDVQTLDRVRANEAQMINYIARMFGILDLTALILALSGIYAVMSFAVSRRTREIGIRVALGSSRARVVLSILRRPLIQVTMGIAAGGALVTWFQLENGLTPAVVLGMAGYMIVALGVCLLACIVPARRALTVDPIAALRTD
jgi:predicted permease